MGISPDRPAPRRLGPTQGAGDSKGARGTKAKTPHRGSVGGLTERAATPPGEPAVGMMTPNVDNNQHAANENLRLQNLWDGIDIYGGLLTEVSG